jgi:hypothetical protein
VGGSMLYSLFSSEKIAIFMKTNIEALFQRKRQLTLFSSSLFSTKIFYLS